MLTKLQTQKTATINITFNINIMIVNPTNTIKKIKNSPKQMKQKFNFPIVDCDSNPISTGL